MSEIQYDPVAMGEFLARAGGHISTFTQENSDIEGQVARLRNPDVWEGTGLEEFNTAAVNWSNGFAEAIGILNEIKGSVDDALQRMLHTDQVVGNSFF